MAHSFDPAPLQAFFDEVSEQLGISLVYLPDNLKFPIQLQSAPEGISRNKCLELLSFIKTQVDLRDNEIGEFYASKKGDGKFVLDIHLEAVKALADVYAVSTFYPYEEAKEETPVRQPKKPKKKGPHEDGKKGKKISGKKEAENDEDSE